MLHQPVTAMADTDRLTFRQQIAAVINRLALAIGGISGVWVDKGP